MSRRAAGWLLVGIAAIEHLGAILIFGMMAQAVAHEMAGGVMGAFFVVVTMLSALNALAAWGTYYVLRRLFGEKDEARLWAAAAVASAPFILWGISVLFREAWPLELVAAVAYYPLIVGAAAIVVRRRV